MKYTLNQLQIFLKIAETGSVTQAAKDLHLTQPAVSIQLKNFQDQFDIPLTEIIGRRIFVTDFGKEVAVSAESILNQVHNIQYKEEAFKGLLTGKLKISTVSTGKYVMPYFLVDFIKAHPGIDLVMDVTNKTKVLQNLENNDVDFALVFINPEIQNLESMDVLKNRLYLVGSPNLPIPSGKTIDSVFKKLPLIYREKGSGTRQIMENFIEQNNISITKKFELSSNEAVKQSLIAGLGYSIMPLIGIKNELQNKDLHIIPLPELPIVTSWKLVWLKEKKQSPVAKAYLEFMKLEMQTIVQTKFAWYESYV